MKFKHLFFAGTLLEVNVVITNETIEILLLEIIVEKIHATWIILDLDKNMIIGGTNEMIESKIDMVCIVDKDILYDSKFFRLDFIKMKS